MVAAMSAAEREEHEDRALKLRKAMGENLGDDVEGEDVSARERRLNLIRCEPVMQARPHSRAEHSALCGRNSGLAVSARECPLYYSGASQPST